jgi:hypothetical protein
LSWYLGAIGELEVARVLDQLGADWSVIHALPVGTGGSDIDHLVIGPGGVYTINSKYHEGRRVWVGSKRILVDGQRTDHLRNVAFEARRVGKLLSRSARTVVEATPILAIVGARSITVRERPANAVVLSSNQLVRWLRRRPVVLTPDEVNQVLRAAFDAATWGNHDLKPADLAGFAELRDVVAKARLRRRMWAVVALLTPFAVLAAAFIRP